MDQINPGGGYYQSNVQFVVDWINRAKGQMSQQRFAEELKELKELLNEQ